MPLNLPDYIAIKDYWKGICEYISDYSDMFAINIQVLTDNEIKSFLNGRFNSLSPGPDTAKKERDNFRKCTKDLHRRIRNSVSRLNLYRLIFSLRFESGYDAVREANNLLINYLLEPELSARNLADFIMIAALETDLEWLEAYSLYNDYKDYMLPPSPSDYEEKGRTIRLLNTALSFSKDDDLKNYLGDPGKPSEILKHFAITNNTKYQVFFNHFQIRKEDESIIIFDDDGDYTKKDLHNIIVGLKNWDDSPDNNNKDSLTEEEILRLSEIFPNVFMTADTFHELTQRKRNVEISHGIMLLKLLEEMDPNPEDDDEFVDFTNIEEIRENARLLFMSVGLPDISKNDAFDRLVMDTYEEVIIENPDADSVTIKSQLFMNLRHYCKMIAHLQ